MINALIALIGSGAAVSLKCWQQLNVMNRNLKMIPIVSVAMAAAEVLVVSRIVLDGTASIIPMGIGGSIGCLIAIKTFDKVYKNETNK